MIKITKRVEYALMVLKHMHEHSETLTTAREVSDIYSIPFDTASKVMQMMNQHGLFISSKGANGGYQLKKTLHEINYLELAEMIEGKSFIMNCQEGPCDLLGSCNITFPIKRLNEYLVGIFTNLSLHELLNAQPLIYGTAKEVNYEHKS